MFKTSLFYAACVYLLLCQLVAANVTSTTETIKPVSEQPDEKPELKLEEVYDNYRLPTAVIPENYKLEVTTHLGDKEGFTFKGNVLITVSQLNFSLTAESFCYYK